ncbi:MAG: ATP-binding cassette domain-containing protein [Myxococcota bacterium]
MRRLTAEGVEKAYGDRRILRGCDLRAEDGDRIGLVGVNGSGKSTFVRILSGEETLDLGRVERAGRMAFLSQDPELPGATVGESIEEAMSWHHTLLEGYNAALAEGDMTRAGTIQDRLDVVGWDLTHKADAMLDRLDAPPRSAPTVKLSGGERRRVALARALLAGADLLFLDEPTNHLDAATVSWLESYLSGFSGAVVLVTHDRYLLENVATRIIEIERGVTVGYEGSYGDYLLERAERQMMLARVEERRMGLIASEAAWAARQPSARGTKQKARLKRLEALQSQENFRARKDMSLDFSTGTKFGGTLLDAQGVRKSFGDRTLINGLYFSVAPGDRVGIIGPNGAGKSTLLKMLLGRLSPDTGEILLGSRVKVGLLDQERTGLKESDTVFEAAGGGNDHVKVGENFIHVASLLSRFLFDRTYLDQLVAGLSGGERARLLMAKLLLQGSSLLMLDEPTNDLDLETLRVLEEALLTYDGGVIVVTHDRAFLDRVCTSVLSFEGDGQIVQYADRSQAEAAAERARQQRAEAAAPKVTETKTESGRRDRAARLSYKEKRELEALPGKIDALETEQSEINATLSDPATYQNSDGAKVAALTQRLAELEGELEALYARWGELDERS